MGGKDRDLAIPEEEGGVDGAVFRLDDDETGPGARGARGGIVMAVMVVPGLMAVVVMRRRPFGRSGA